MIDPDGPEQSDGTGRLFEVPIVPPLPEDSTSSRDGKKLASGSWAEMR